MLACRRRSNSVDGHRSLSLTSSACRTDTFQMRQGLSPCSVACLFWGGKASTRIVGVPGLEPDPHGNSAVALPMSYTPNGDAQIYRFPCVVPLPLTSVDHRQKGVAFRVTLAASLVMKRQKYRGEGEIRTRYIPLARRALNLMSFIPIRHTFSRTTRGLSPAQQAS